MNDKTAVKGEETKTPEQLEKEAALKKNAAIKRRLGKKADKAHQQDVEKEKRYEIIEEENRILKEKLNPVPATKPTLESCGGDTELFSANIEAFYKGQKQKEVTAGVAAGVEVHQQKQALQSHEANTQASLDDHYDKAQKAGIEGFEKAEENAIEWLGEGVVQEIIAVVDNSPQVIHLLGSNQEEAEKLVETLKQSATRGTVAIGRLSARADKFKNNNEDDDLDPENIPEGGNLPVSDAALIRRHDKLVEDCGNGAGDMKKLAQARAEMREKGLLKD